MGRFPLYADADIHGPLIAALVRKGWDVARAVDLYPEGTADAIHFERAAREQRVLVSNDKDQELLALAWLKAGRAFPGLVTWAKRHEQRMTVGDFLGRFEDLAAREQAFPPDYPIVYLKPGR